MPAKPPIRGTTTVEVHAPPRLPNGPNAHPDAAPRIKNDWPPALRPSTSAGPADLTSKADPDAIAPAQTIIVSEIASAPVAIPAAADRALERYQIASAARLPAPDERGLRVYRGRLFVDGADGTLQVGLDAESGLYRAKLPKELKPSGPVLVQDPASKLWIALTDGEAITWPLNVNGLEAFHTGLDFSGVEPDGEGLHLFEGKRYAVIHRQAFQVLLDRHASTSDHKVWRIVNAKDPVAGDSENVYHASRPGESRAISRNARHEWVAVLAGLRGGMRRNLRADLMQRYLPIRNAFDAMVASSHRYAELWSQATSHPEGSTAHTAALIAVEVHILKHIRMQAEYTRAFIENKEWLVMMKSGGLYNEELLSQQLDRVMYFNKLLVAMDQRLLPSLNEITVQTCKAALAHLNKKLKVLDERQGVIDQIKKTFRHSEFELDELNRGIPAVDSINYSRLNFCLRLFSDGPNTAPPIGLETFAALEFFVRDLNNLTPAYQPVILQMGLEPIAREKSQFEALLLTQTPAKAEYIREILSIISTFESRIEKKLTDIYDDFGSNAELPSHDQDIDFDFIPPQRAGSSAPLAARKIFRTRHHGRYKVLVGEKDIAADGSITVRIENPFTPGHPPRRYEKRQGEWHPITLSSPVQSRAQLIGEANARLADVDAHRSQSRKDEAMNAPPANIVEFLNRKADELGHQAKLLGNVDKAEDDVEVKQLIQQLNTAADQLNAEGQTILLRMYKNKDVLDALRLNYLLDHGELSITKTVDRELRGKGKTRSFLDVYTINNRADNAPLWEAHFHYDRKDRPALDYTIKGANMKTLAQSKLGSAFQQREALAGRAHQQIWRVVISPTVAQKLFDHAQT